MPVEGVFTAAEKEAIVLEHLMLPQGQKAKFLEKHGLTRWRVRRWKAAYLAGTLDYGLVPREGADVDKDEIAAVKNLRAENLALKAQLAASEDELRTQQEVADVLGKAIEILRQSGSKTSGDSAAASKLEGES